MGLEGKMYWCSFIHLSFKPALLCVGSWGGKQFKSKKSVKKVDNKSQVVITVR